MEKLEKILGRRDIDTASLRPWKDGHSLVVPCQESLATWLTLRSLVPVTGLWPVLREPGDLDHDGLARDCDPRTVAQLIEAADLIDPSEWLRTRHREQLDDLEAGLQGEESSHGRAGIDAKAMKSWRQDLIADDGFPRGPWPRDRGPREFRTTLTQSWRGLEELAVVLVPAEESWHIPAHLYLGNWNECPAPDVHVAVFSYWHQRHEAEVMTVTQDVVEMRVGRPPMTREEAIGLAKEQYLYCNDIVDQGTNTIDRLAAELLENPVWFFWWD